jgi:hypothetical protein
MGGKGRKEKLGMEERSKRLSQQIYFDVANPT